MGADAPVDNGNIGVKVWRAMLSAPIVAAVILAFSWQSLVAHFALNMGMLCQAGLSLCQSDAESWLQRASRWQPELANVAVAQARSLAERGDLTGARQKLELALTMASSETYASYLHFLLGDLCDRLGDTVGADEHWALSGNSHALARRAKALVLEGGLARAARLYRVALRAEPRNAEMWTQLAEVYYSQGKGDQAIAACQAALQLDPKSADAYYVLGIVARYLQGDTDEAVKFWHQAVISDPKHAKALIHLGHVARERDDLDQALTWYQRAVEASPRSHSALLGLGMTLLAQGYPAQAELYLRQAVDIKPGDSEIRYWLGQAQMANGNLSVAEGSFLEAIKLNQKSLLAWIALGDARRLQEDLRGAQQAYQQALQIAPDRADILGKLREVETGLKGQQ